MIEVNSFAELRTTVPPKSGEVASLKRYYDKDSSFRGGADFVGFLSTTPLKDDGGTVAVGNGFYWKRTINDPAEVNILHFGAKGDGVTDDTDAFRRMLTWTQTYNTYAKAIPVRFPGGRFLISPIDLSDTELSFFGLSGDDMEQGSSPRTTIVSDKSANPVFKVMARRIAIQGIAWHGQANADISAKTTIRPEQCSNVQPFFENTITGGQVVNIYCFKSQSSGGPSSNCRIRSTVSSIRSTPLTRLPGCSMWAGQMQRKGTGTTQPRLSCAIPTSSRATVMQSSTCRA